MIAIVKYNAGNIGSVTNALNRLGIENKVTDDPEELKAADKVIFPGVGEAGTAMNYLRERGLDQVIRELKQPVLGICLGMQLMCSHSEEGDTECLGIFDTTVKKFPATEGMKVPHMGWNSLNTEVVDQQSSILQGLQPAADVYYVHSYYAEVCENTVAACDYILPFSSVLQKDNFYATQFHPEKSAGIGEQILKNFIEL
ncbi:glutamine amidotransferase [Nonlabens xylanidelens]|uniref:Imidazole glycerol phosphate synthase subunit HisH n=1 Tax=Nonlabens xylanidelens TaxID=191564 RepID=A0A2S6IJN9_9FLAO|nr:MULTISPECIES: imidazole glycerol phosphate synthase subunit HisH [Nonlabens]PPK94395.1 glutamine amidotransferase [Nonlabens xylanidelens]PQJ21443.1 imidazole glycerol phosphate synthase subunit HisH [Nonlabens xylanidelens]WOI21765.1 imidazole glycerol phosphate synthase subunit HisH [Nonlabens ulvanivorans]